MHGALSTEVPEKRLIEHSTMRTETGELKREIFEDYGSVGLVLLPRLMISPTVNSSRALKKLQVRPASIDWKRRTGPGADPDGFL